MRNSTAFYAATLVATILVASVTGYPLLAQTAIAAFHEDSGANGTAMENNNTAMTGEVMNDTGIASTGATVEVAAGSNATVQYYTFTPQTVEIDAGESVTWSSSAELADIHTVTFVLDQNVTSDLILPFAIPEQASADDFELLPPFNVGEPIIVQTPDGREAIVALNKHVFYPAIVDASNETTFLNGSDIEYSLDGTEKAINSGIIQPPFPPTAEQENDTAIGAAEIPPDAAMNETVTTEAPEDIASPTEGPPFPFVNSFTLTFEEPGTYQYFCAVHPWMGGQVVVRGDNATAASATAP